MMGGDKKKIAQIIIESSGPSAEKNAQGLEDVQGGSLDAHGDMMIAASDAMRAFHAKDVNGLKDALYSFHSCATNAIDDDKYDGEEEADEDSEV